MYFKCKPEKSAETISVALGLFGDCIAIEKIQMSKTVLDKLFGFEVEISSIFGVPVEFSDEAGQFALIYLQDRNQKEKTQKKAKK